jgi:hypothetical protein
VIQLDQGSLQIKTAGIDQFSMGNAVTPDTSKFLASKKPLNIKV